MSNSESLPHVDESTESYATKSSILLGYTTSSSNSTTSAHQQPPHKSNILSQHIRKSQISTNNQKVGTANYSSDSLSQQGSNKNDFSNHGVPREITNSAQRRSTKIKTNQLEYAEIKSDSSTNSKITELRPSSTIGRPKRRSLLPS
jgi:hypothetical protein